jgi:HSP20 family protein
MLAGPCSFGDAGIERGLTCLMATLEWNPNMVLRPLRRPMQCDCMARNTSVVDGILDHHVFNFKLEFFMANNLMRFDPFAEIARFDPFSNLDDVFKDLRVAPAWRGVEAAPRIRMDMTETDKEYTVKAEIPGVKKDEIKVSIVGNQVSISAEVRKEEEKKEGNMMRSERYYGQQFRSFTLPEEVDESKSVAKYNDGILELTLPKKPGTGAKQLAIQ